MEWSIGRVLGGSLVDTVPVFGREGMQELGVLET